MPGVYNEYVTIGKSITLTGDCGDENTRGPGPDAPILVGTGFKSKAAFRIEGASNVTIEGFEIKNYEGGYNSYGVIGYGTGVNNITIRHNYIHNVESDGVFAFNGYGVEVLSGWTVTHNIIEDFGGEGGVNFENVGESMISNNRISNPTSEDSDAIFLNAYATSSNPIIISDVKIKGNEIIDIPGKAIHVHSCAEQYRYSATVQNVDISDNTVTGNLSAISIWKTGDGTTKLQDINITNNNLTIHNTTDWYNVAVWLESISGTSSFSDNTVKISGGRCDAIAIRGDDTGSWTVNDNYFDGHGTSIGICFIWVPESATLEMNRNTVIGWVSGIVTNYQGHSQAVLRDNLIYSNNTGVENRVMALSTPPSTTGVMRAVHTMLL